VVIINEETQKLELEYPCNWCYKVVAYERAGIEIAVMEILAERPYSLNPSKTSSSGKYISMNLELLVHNEDERTYFYETLKAHQHIKMVL
jgi:putative lipoic acid-binding regulatory protein